jgi:phospholipase C
LDSAVNASNGSKIVAQNGTLAVRGWAAANDGGTITQVQILIDSVAVGNATLGSNSDWSFTYNIGNLAAGTHYASATATDSIGARAALSWSSSNSGTFTVSANSPPSGFLDSAVNASDGSKTLAQNGTLAVRGWAAANDGGTITQVQILIDSVAVGNATLGSNSDWSFTYNIGNLAGGTHYASATATDSIGAKAALSWSSSNAGEFSVTATNANAINHVIFMLQENRTFDNYFGMLNAYRKANGWNIGDDGKEYDVDGLDGSKASISNPMDQGTGPNGTTPSFTPFKFATTCTDDMSSAWLESFGDVNRYDFSTSRALEMNGFVHSAENEAINNGYGDTQGKRAMGYFDQGFLNYYYYMASQFAVSDRWFSPVASKTIPNRLATMTGGTTQGLVYDPSTDDHLGELSVETVFQELDNAGVSWKIYYTDTDTNDPFPATTFGYFTYSGKYMYSGNCSNGVCIDSSHIAPLSQYFTDVQNGTLPQFAYIEPGYNDGTDEHPAADVAIGQQHVANIINALMNSPSWKDSVFFLSYDEGGGPFDHVPPVPGHSNDFTDSALAGIAPDISSIAVNPDGFNPCAPPSGTRATAHCDLQNYGSYQDPGWNSTDAAAQQGFGAQLGFRLPNLVISPFTRRHYVSHIPMDHTAIIKFVENRFIGSGAHLTNRDAAQPNLLNFFDFNAVPWSTPPTPPTPAGGSCSPEDL